MSELTLEDIKNLAKQMVTHEVLSVGLNGGEPLIRKDFLDILEIFYLHNIPIQVSTNACLLNKEIIELMDKFHVIKYTLSLEGSNSETNDFIRGENSFKKIIASISNLRKASPLAKVEVEVTYGKHNLKEIEEIVLLLENLGVAKVKLARLKPWNWGKKLKYLVPSKEEIGYLNEKALELNAKYNIDVEGDIPVSRPSGCNVNLGFEVQPNGDVLPCRIFEQCSDDKKVVVGNIKRQNLLTIWENEKLQEIRALAKKLTEAVHCNCCSFSPFCATNYCIAENYLKFSEFIPSINQLKKCEMY